MTHDPLLPMLHPCGEQLPVEVDAASGPVTLETFAGPVRVEWDASSPVTPLGQIIYFIEFLKVSGRFDALIGDCPLAYASPNAPAVRDVIGTWVAVGVGRAPALCAHHGAAQRSGAGGAFGAGADCERGFAAAGAEGDA